MRSALDLLVNPPEPAEPERSHPVLPLTREPVFPDRAAMGLRYHSVPYPEGIASQSPGLRGNRATPGMAAGITYLGEVAAVQFPGCRSAGSPVSP